MKTIAVRVPANLTLEQSQKVLASVLNKAGHPTCFSGHEISFENAVSEKVVLGVEKGSLNVHEVGG